MSVPRIRPEFAVHRLNADGMAKADRIALCFSNMLDFIEDDLDLPPSREHSLARTHLEQAAFYVKRAMASQGVNQQAAPVAMPIPGDGTPQ